MATTTVNLLTALTAADSGDKIPIWDITAGQYKAITKANLLGGAMSGTSLTIPQTTVDVNQALLIRTQCDEIIQRLLQAIAVMAAMSVIVFVGVYAIGNPIDVMIDPASDQALREALGDKRGIARYGFLLPMDEALAQVAIDLSGRAYAVFEGSFGRDSVGGLPTELVPHFFRSLADSLGAAIHIQVRGENTHHMVEACFKGVGRALRQAIHLEGTELPSSKGVL
jgi:hypothetical protein